MNKRDVAAEAFPPGEFLRDELDARGWTQDDFAMILGRNPRDVSDIVNAKRQITPRTALELAEALGTSASFWLNLQSQFDLFRAAVAEERSHIADRARLFEKAPIKKMIGRGWIANTRDPEVLEGQLLKFFDIRSLDETPQVWRHAARKSDSYAEVTPAQWAWLCRARALARNLQAKRFTTTRFKVALQSLKTCLEAREEIRRVPAILADGGVRVVVVESLPGAKIDGACFWLDKHSPVVVISMRYDRIDWWWFTLMHELGHVTNGDGLSHGIPLDVDLLAGVGSDSIPDYEQAANVFATGYLIDREELENFIARVRPLYSKKRIRLFAKRIGVHPGIVVGQLQFRDEIPYAHSRDLLGKVRDIVASVALTDGWGSVPTVAG